MNHPGGSSLSRVGLAMAFAGVSAVQAPDEGIETMRSFRALEEAWDSLRGRGEGGR